jgi:hypothetical protein
VDDLRLEPRGLLRQAQRTVTSSAFMVVAHSFDVPGDLLCLYSAMILEGFAFLLDLETVHGGVHF